MQRPITGVSQDEKSDWVAELSCGHGQHICHKPPFCCVLGRHSPEGHGSMLHQQARLPALRRFELPGRLRCPGSERLSSTRPRSHSGCRRIITRRRQASGGDSRPLRAAPAITSMALMVVNWSLDPGNPGIVLPEVLQRTTSQPMDRCDSSSNFIASKGLKRLTIEDVESLKASVANCGVPHTCIKIGAAVRRLRHRCAAWATAAGNAIAIKGFAQLDGTICLVIAANEY